MTKAEWIEENRNALETIYHETYMECVASNDESLWETLAEYEKTLVNLGILEGDEPEDERLDTSTNWDEWALDNRIDRMREEGAAV